MNYYRVQSTYFLIFITISAIAFVAIPFVRDAFTNISDTYIKAQMNRIRSEMFLGYRGAGSFDHTCYVGTTGDIIRDLIDEYGRKVVCHTNHPKNSEMFVYIELHSGEFYSVDSLGGSCQTIDEPVIGFQCSLGS